MERGQFLDSSLSTWQELEKGKRLMKTSISLQTAFVLTIMAAGCNTATIPIHQETVTTSPPQSILSSTKMTAGPKRPDMVSLEEIRLPPSFTIEPNDILQQINHINWVACRIQMQGTVLEDEYRMIDRVNYNFLKDPQLINAYQDLLDDLTETRIREGDRELLKRTFDRQMKNAIFESAPDPIAVVSGDPKAIGFALAQGAFSWFMNYRRIREMLRLQYDKDVWQLDKDEIRDIDDFRKDMLREIPELVNHHKINDKKVIKQESFEALYRHLNEDTPNDLLDWLSTTKTQTIFEYSTFYWYHRGIVALSLGRNAEALESFKVYQHIRSPFLMKDRMAAIVAENMINLILQSDGDETGKREEIRKQLEVLLENAQIDSDWDLYYFAAIVQFNSLNDPKGALQSIRQAEGQLRLSFRSELNEYLDRLKKEKKLWFDDDKLIKENRIPDSDNLTVCRILRHVIQNSITKNGIDSQSIQDELKRLETGALEQLFYMGMVEGAGAHAVLPSLEVVSRDEIWAGIAQAKDLGLSRLYADYDYSDDFIAEIPLRWLFFGSTNMTFTFTLYSGDEAVEVLHEKDWKEYRSVRFNEGSGVSGRRSVTPYVRIEFEGDDVTTSAESIDGYELNISVPPFRVDIRMADVKGRTTDIGGANMYPDKIVFPKISPKGLYTGNDAILFVHPDKTLSPVAPSE